MPASVKQKIRDAFGGTIILAGGNSLEISEAALAEGRGDLFAFARAFIANPRLPTKLRAGTPLLQPDFATFYTADEKGYTDYPVEG